MRELVATIISLVVVVGTVWGVFATMVFAVQEFSSFGVPSGLLYFSAGVCFGALYKNLGEFFGGFCITVWEKISRMVMW